MASMDISLIPCMPGIMLPPSWGAYKCVLCDYGVIIFFGRIRLRRKEGVTRIRESKRRRSPPPPRHLLFRRTGTGVVQVVQVSAPHGGCEPRAGHTYTTTVSHPSQKEVLLHGLEPQTRAPIQSA